LETLILAEKVEIVAEIERMDCTILPLDFAYRMRDDRELMDCGFTATWCATRKE
jgi:hypothetical protein